VAIATDAVQVFGGTGYMRETGAEKLMRDAKCLQLWPEPNWVARERLVGILHPPPPDQGPSGS
jgi:alkylation response protein AidB-like acyl-CoA dehydrogenase